MSGLYIHIPFCAKKCAYCDFYSFHPTDAQMDAYCDAVTAAFLRYAGTLNTDFDTVYFGGGTPSFFGAKRLTALLDAARDAFTITGDAEITVECNPSSVTENGMQTLAATGINRISMGVQSAVDGERRWLGRSSSRKQVEAAINTCRKASLTNLSLDLMLGIPAQTMASLDESLDFITGLGVPHVSAYLLKLEDGTPLAAQKETLPLPDEDSVCDCYLHTVETLRRHGLMQYEVSNFARPGFESRHNLHYWRDEAYLGIGPAAHSFLGGKRFYYPRDFEAFLRGDAPVPDGDGGSEAEFVMLRLRLAEGLSDGDFFARYRKHLPNALFDAANTLKRHGLVTVQNDTVALTPQGFLLSNRVIDALLSHISSQ